ncbi:FAD-binding oxidoreductase [Candidatus Daviesbacteria bacterium]|nr:FAD-binding oxidoreductase [Candidatus Daviesbacteria bacterium]MBI4038560.1 FAD-binding oxidoreductase [Candidatus Daviesbacteria bacterium]
MSPKDDLQKIIQGEVLDDHETLSAYSHDASIFEIKPKVVVFPKNANDITQLVRFINQHPKDNLSITVHSAGTDMTGGAINDSIILDIKKYLNSLIKVSEQSTIVQPGMLYRDFEAETLKQNLLLPTYPASREICTIGGMVATNAGGELELTYGPINKYLKKLKVVLADGYEYTFQAINQNELNKKITQQSFEGKIYSEIYELIKENEELIKKAKPQTSKNSTGYDLWEVWDGKTFDLSKLIIGSQGTLGIITEAEFSLIKPQPHQVLLVISLTDLSQLDQIVKTVLEFGPEAFECYDDQTLKLAQSHAWDISANFKHSNRISAFLNLFLEKLLKNPPSLTLLANFTSGSKKEALQQAQMAKNALSLFNLKVKIKETSASQEKYWLIRHKSFGLLMKYSGTDKKASSFIDDIIVKPEYLPQFLPKLNQLIEPYKDKMVYTLAGHIGDGNFHIIPLMDLSKEDVREIIPELMEKVFKLVFEYKGSMSAEHNDGLIRGAYLPLMYGNEVYQLFKKVKEIFDPNNIFNPHKKVDATFGYSFNHLAKN